MPTYYFYRKLHENEEFSAQNAAHPSRLGTRDQEYPTEGKRGQGPENRSTPSPSGQEKILKILPSLVTSGNKHLLSYGLVPIIHLGLTCCLLLSTNYTWLSDQLLTSWGHLVSVPGFEPMPPGSSGHRGLVLNCLLMK